MSNHDSSASQMLAKAYPASRSRLASSQWAELSASYERRRKGSRATDPGFTGAFPEFLEKQTSSRPLPPFLPDLSAVERACDDVAADPAEIPHAVERLTINPTLVAIQVGWRLDACLSDDAPPHDPPEREDQLLLIWRMPRQGNVRVLAAGAQELLVMKMVHEGLSPGEVARLGNVSVVHVNEMVRDFAGEGGVILPRSRLRRQGKPFDRNTEISENLLSTPGFTLQWHLTNACELHCTHCYDRTLPSPLTLEQSREVVASMVAFCEKQRVAGKIALTGGNPFMFRGFTELYSIIADTDLDIAILGNPVSRRQLEKLVEIRRPSHFQVSLEGLEATNDAARGPGHFQRVMKFLPMLREVGIRSGVMLTAGRDNLDEVIPLANLLRGKVDRFNFNRLCQTGEGADLAIPGREEFEQFLRRYREAARSNPAMKFKDNFFNILRHEAGETLLPGCTGHGCGAAFDFMALLPDGEAHACRKFPSPVGNVLERGIEAAYESPAAASYRRGPAPCDDCPIRAGCGGCLAVTSGQGRDPLQTLDPHCFFSAGRR